MASISAEEGASLGLKAPTKSISADEGAALGLKHPGVEAVQATPEAPKKDPLADHEWTAFGLGSLNKLAMGGGSAALALKDMLSSVDSRTGQKGVPAGMGPKELYLSNKKFYDEGFDRLGKANPTGE